MRSKQTNFLQVTVIITGIVYIALGVILFFSPVTLFKLFSVTISDSWYDLIKQNELVAPIYTMLRGMGALLVTVGISNIMPLFEPERYRGLIYYNNIVFPGLALVLLIHYSVALLLGDKSPGESLGDLSGHLVIPAFSLVLLIVLILSLVGVIITRNGKR